LTFKLKLLLVNAKNYRVIIFQEQICDQNIESLETKTIFFLQNSAAALGFDNFYALIGGFQTSDRRYLDYVDGFSMMDGIYNDASSQVTILHT
jgi:hypothetical protein